tara:strand:- start:6926 stop:7318 length:393 start_codon:yes stop_codon:yes gene_type:complete
MLRKMISNRLDAIISPVRNELRLAQEQAAEQIQQVILNAEEELAHKGKFMTPEQRLQQAEKELEKAEEQLLSALSSIMKALWYVAPQSNPFIRIPLIKEIKGRVIEKGSEIEPVQENTSKLKLGFFTWKK